MNSVQLAIDQCRTRPDQIALWLPGGSLGHSTTFGELEAQATQIQSRLIEMQISQGDVVLIIDNLGPRLYSTIIALLSLGATVMLVEPWMPVAKIEHAVQTAQPKAFIHHFLGKLWGARVPAIRKIDKWIAASKLESGIKGHSLVINDVDPNVSGILTFTSGTTGNPKGVVRSQGYLIEQHRVLSKALHFDRYPGTDLCIFANFVLANLASGRGSLVIPPGWKPKALRQIDQLPSELLPQTTTCGPAFLLELLRQGDLSSLQAIDVGGALTDCWIFEEAFKKWPEAQVTHIYGSSEAEPVALADAREAVQKSREAGLFQTLYLGQPVPEIQHQIEPDGVWIAGPHVCPRYLGNAEENKLYKREDSNGVIWHYMGDRIQIRDSQDGGWWYAGRSNQISDDFQLEQKHYSQMQSSKSFIYRKKDGSAVHVGEGQTQVRAKIYRDRRHRARIDRKKTLEKGAKWLLG